MLKELANLTLETNGRYAQNHELQLLEDYLEGAVPTFELNEIALI